MTVIDYYNTYRDRRLVVGLGYFDSVHKGHKYLIEHVKKLAKTLDATPAIFSFKNNPFDVIGKDIKSIFTFKERCLRLEHIGVEVIIGAEVDKTFFDMTGDEFLDILTNNFDIVGFVSGTDYTYGKMARWGKDDLIAYADRHGIRYDIVDLIENLGKKIASRDIRAYLLDGDIQLANSLLTEPYSMSGNVKKGRQDGAKIGFPTANIDIEDGLLIIKNGVYSSIAVVDGVRYRAVTNVGGHPTFGDNRKNVEAYIIDFDEEIYGKEIEIIFSRYLRGISKFDSVEELRDTIARDEQTTIREVEL